MTIAQYCAGLGLSDYFFYNFLVPMSSAVWSTPIEKIDFPAKSLVRFFYNHGFDGVNTQLQWKTVIGGSREYRNRIIEKYKDRIQMNCPALKVVQHTDKVEVHTSKRTELLIRSSLRHMEMKLWKCWIIRQVCRAKY